MADESIDPRDNLIRTQSAEISRLTREVAAEKNRNRKARRSRGDWEREREQLAAQITQLQEQLAQDPDQVRGELAEARQQLSALKHRDAFARVALAAGLNPAVPLEKVWAVLGYRPEGEPDAQKIGQFLANAKQSDGWLFQSPPSAEPPGNGQTTIAPGSNPNGAPAGGLAPPDMMGGLNPALYGIQPPAPSGGMSTVSPPSQTVFQHLPSAAGMAPPPGFGLQPGLPQQPGPGLARGTPDLSSGVLTVRQSDFSDAQWMKQNQERVAKAYEQGTLNVIAG